MEWKNLSAISQASFYGKAKTATGGDYTLLKSYDIIVCKYNNKTGEFVRMWSGYSVTTMKHVNDFRHLFDLAPLSRKEWLALPCTNQQQLYRIQVGERFCCNNLLTHAEVRKEVERLEALYNGDRYNVYIDMVEA